MPSATHTQLLKVESSNVRYRENCIESVYTHVVNNVTVSNGDVQNGSVRVKPTHERLVFKTSTEVPKLGVMLVGLGGNNGSTFSATVLANRLNMTWHTKRGKHTANYIGSMSQSATMSIGMNSNSSEEIFVPFGRVVPMVDPNQLEVGGWDISSMNLADAAERAAVLDYDLQRQLRPHLESIRPLPSVYSPSWIASNQSERADNVLGGTLADKLKRIRADIRAFRAERGVDACILMWTANTEKMCSLQPGVHDSWANLDAAIAANREDLVSPSCLFAVAACLERCIAFINGSPQNSLVPAVVDLARANGVFLAGDDFKTGQTKVKCVLLDFLVSAGLKPRSIVSYNHLGNNDGKNLSEAEQFRSKEISKSGVLDDFLKSNPLLYARDPVDRDEVRADDRVDHTIVIKYIPYVGDSKRAMDEYTSEILLGGTNTLVMHNTCEDSLLAVPVMLDLVLFTELLSRIQMAKLAADDQHMSVRVAKTKMARMDDGEGDVTLHLHEASDELVLANTSLIQFGTLETLLASTLGYFLKAPCVDSRVPLVNSLFRQRAAIENLLRACVGLSPIDHTFLDRKVSLPVSNTTVADGVGFRERIPDATALKLSNGHATNGAKVNGHSLTTNGTNGHANYD